MEAASNAVVALVLGAGGVRGCAHAGVTEVLRSEGIRIDRVVGSSVGAIFGLAVAAGVPSERVSRLTRESTSFDLFRFYAGRLRTDRRNPIARLVYEAALDRTFEDLPIPFAVMATDMASGEVHVLDRGPLLPAIEASFALPFIARPVRIGESLYLDGGIRDGTPVGVARAMGATHVISVHLGVIGRLPLQHRAWARSTAKRLGNQRKPIAPRLSDQMRFGMRLFSSDMEPVPPEMGDVAIWPEFAGISPRSISGGRQCFESGVRAARAALPALQGWPRIPVTADIPFEHIP